MDSAKCPSVTAQSFTRLFSNRFGADFLHLLCLGPCPQPIFRLFEEPCPRGRSNAEMGFSPILTQQSSRMIFPLASQAGIEPKTMHRSQDPDSMKLLLLISPSGGRRKRVVWTCCASNTAKHKQSQGRRTGSGPGGYPIYCGQVVALLARAQSHGELLCPAAETDSPPRLRKEGDRTEPQIRHQKLKSQKSKKKKKRPFSKGSQKKCLLTEPALCDL